MTSIPVAHGVAVTESSTYGKDQQQQQSYQHTNGSAYTRVAVTAVSDAESLQQLRTEPIQKFQDVPWAVAFYLHVFVMAVVIAMSLSQNDSDGAGASPSTTTATATPITTHLGTLLTLTGVTGGAAVLLSISSLQFMLTHAETLVQTALLFSVLSSLTLSIAGFCTGSMLMGGLGLLSFCVGCCYAKAVWPRIPFAAANLKTALSAVQVNLGLTLVSLLLTALAFVWTIFWFLGVGKALQGENMVVVFVLFLSYYWVHQVLQNTVHVTTAGVVGTWWWVPLEASTFWSPALTGSLGRATTYSFGSICFGSFLVALVQALRALERESRNSEDMQFLSCIIQCILSMIESIIECLNRWAYVYVGLYGFSYLEAGRNVLQLFEAKGWTALVADDLAENVLSLVSVGIGLASGLVGCIMGMMNANMFEGLGYDEAAVPAFLVGLTAGFLFASILLSVVGSAVNTVIVCYAEDPAAFQTNHPQLSTDMRSAWVKAWPGLVN